MYIQHSLIYAVRNFLFKLANISRNYDGCFRGPLFIGTQCIYNEIPILTPYSTVSF